MLKEKWVWWYTLVISSPGKLRHNGDKFEASLGKVVRLSQKNNGWGRRVFASDTQSPGFNPAPRKAGVITYTGILSSGGRVGGPEVQGHS